MKALVFGNVLFYTVALLMILCRIFIPQRGEYEEGPIGGTPLYLGKGALNHVASHDRDLYSYSSVYAVTIPRIFDIIAAAGSFSLAVGCILLRYRTNNMHKRRLADVVTSTLLHVGIAHILFYAGGHVIIVLSTTSLEIPVLYYLGVIIAGVDAAVTMDKFREYKESMLEENHIREHNLQSHLPVHNDYSDNNSNTTTRSTRGISSRNAFTTSSTNTNDDTHHVPIIPSSVPVSSDPSQNSPRNLRSEDYPDELWPLFMEPRRLLSLCIGHTFLSIMLCTVRTFPVPEVNLPVNIFLILWVIFAIYRAWDGGLYGPGENFKYIKHLSAVEQLAGARLNLLRGGIMAAFIMFAPMIISLVAELLYSAHILPHNVADVLIRQQLFLRALEGGYILVTSVTANDEKAAFDAVKTKLQERIAQDAVRQALIRYLFHEVRVPLNSVYLGLKLMHDEENSFTLDQNRILAIMLAATQTAIGVMSDTLDLARLERGDAWVPQLSPADVQDMMNDIISQNQPFAVGHGVTLECSIDTNVPTYVLCAKSQVQQILNNFLTNGIKFSSMVNRKVVHTSSTFSGLSPSKRLSKDQITMCGKVTIWVSTTPPDELFRSYDASKWHNASKSIMSAAGSDEVSFDRVPLIHDDHQDEDDTKKHDPRDGSILQTLFLSVLSVWKCLYNARSNPPSSSNSFDSTLSILPSENVSITAPHTKNSSTDENTSNHRSFSSKVQNITSHPPAVTITPIATKLTTKPIYEDIEAHWYVQGKPCTLYFTVIDNGCGIPADDLGHLFRAFQQLEAGSRYRGRGTGLGLAISRSVASILGGVVGLASTVGRGTVFALQLPLQPLNRTTIAPTPREEKSNFDNLSSQETENSTANASTKGNYTNRTFNLSGFTGFTPHAVNNGSETTRSRSSNASSVLSKDRPGNFLNIYNSNSPTNKQTVPVNDVISVSNGNNNILQQLLHQNEQQKNNQAVLDRLFKGKDDKNSTYARMALWAPTGEAIQQWWQQQQRSPQNNSLNDTGSELYRGGEEEMIGVGVERLASMDKATMDKATMDKIFDYSKSYSSVMDSTPDKISVSNTTAVSSVPGQVESQNYLPIQPTLASPSRPVRVTDMQKTTVFPSPVANSRPSRPIMIEPSVPPSVTYSTIFGENIAVRFFVVDDVLSNREFLARLLRRRCGTNSKVYEFEDGEQILEVMQKYMDEENHRYPMNETNTDTPLGSKENSPLLNPTAVPSSTLPPSVSNASLSSLAAVPESVTSTSLTNGSKLPVRYVNVICMDGDMPIIDGYKATEVLRKTMNFKGLIIGCTGNALAEDQVRFLQAGADIVLCKPIDPSSILSQTKEWIDTHYHSHQRMSHSLPDEKERK